MLEFSCPFCSQTLSVPPDRAGRRVLCPGCRRPVLVPTPTGQPGELPPAPPPTGQETMPASSPLPAHGNSGIAGKVASPEPLPTPSDFVVLHSASSTDHAAELSAAITSRMKPPPEPVGDLRVSTGTLFALVAIAVTLWLGGILFDPDTLMFVTLIGALMFGAGYLWTAYLAGETDWTRGLLTLIPPVTAVRLTQPFGEYGRQPLWFALGGLGILTLGLTGHAARSVVQPMLSEFTGTGSFDSDPIANGPLTQLRNYRERRQDDLLIGYLGELTGPAACEQVSEPMKLEVAAEIEALARDDDRPRVRGAALGALAVWSPEKAKSQLLAAIRSPDQSERRAAMELAPRFPEPEVANAVAQRFPDREERIAAKESLLKMGGSLAESALLPLLQADNQFVVLDVCDVLEQVGGPRSVEAMTALSRSSDDVLIRMAVAQSAKLIATRLGSVR